MIERDPIEALELQRRDRRRIRGGVREVVVGPSIAEHVVPDGGVVEEEELHADPPPGEAPAVENRTNLTASMLVVMPYPPK